MHPDDLNPSATGASPRERPPRIDAHLHIWDLADGEYRWLERSEPALRRSFLPDEASGLLQDAGINGAIVVQAEDSTRDTAFLVDAAARHSFVRGVVGWVQLDTPDVAAGQLVTWAGDPIFVGVRHLIHDDPRSGFLQLPAVRASLSLVADAGLTFDIPDAFPDHLGQVAALAAALPGLRIVVDHLGKPPRASGAEEFQRWERQLRQAAELPNVFAKVSGLRTPGTKYTTEALGRAWNISLDAFGPQRLLYGSDWPVSGAHQYTETLGVIEALAAELGPAGQAAVMGTNAERIYRLPPAETQRKTADETKAGSHE